MSSSGLRETRILAAEIKFVVPAPVGAAIRDWARQHLTADPHGAGPFGDEYDTRTIYFDSAGYDVFHRRGSFGRCKYRIRRYNGSDQVFLERKLRRPGLLTKRRTLTSLASLPRLNDGGEPSGGRWGGEWFHRRLQLRRLQPVCEIGYHRVARAGDSPLGPVRLTLDQALAIRPTSHMEFDIDESSQPFLDGRMILELKYRADVPAVFKRLVEEFRLQPKAISKYRLGLGTLAPQAVLVAQPVARLDGAVAGTPGA